jgi:hypothetical protein
MSLSFPASPSVGQVYNNWVWNGSAWDPVAATPQATSGNRVLLATTIVSTAVATVDFFLPTFSDGTYDIIEIDAFNLGGSVATAFAARLSTDGSTFDVGGTNYGWSFMAPSSTSGSMSAGYNSASYMQLMTAAGTVAQQVAEFRMRCYYFAATGPGKHLYTNSMSHGTSGVFPGVYGGWYLVSPYNPIKGIRFLPISGGNITSGAFSIYGIKK